MRTLQQARHSLAGLIAGFYFGVGVFFYLALSNEILAAIAVAHGLCIVLLAARSKHAAKLVTLTGAGMLLFGITSDSPVVLPFVGILAALSAISVWKAPALSDGHKASLQDYRIGIAAMGLSLYFGVYMMFFALGVVEMIPWEVAKYALGVASCYGLALVALFVRPFWGRWFAVGTAMYGAVMGVLGLAVQWEMKEIHLFLLATHGIPLALLMGRPMEKLFEGAGNWRERFNIEAGAANQLRKAITRAGMFLPITIGYALAPGQDQSTTIALLALTVFATVGLVRGKTVSLLALGGASIVLATDLLWGSKLQSFDTLSGVLGLSIMIVALLPFIQPIWNYLTRETTNS